MSRPALLALFLLAAPTALAQTPTPPDGVFTEVERQPELVGGLAALLERVQYPPSAQADGVEGRVIVQLVVDEGGRPTDLAVARSPDPRLSEAALDAVRATEFTPGRQGGEPVKVRFSLPITFRLSGADAGAGGGASGSSTWSDDGTRGPIFWDTEWSGELDRLLDHVASSRAYLGAMVAARVAYDGAEPFADLTPGSATVRFTIDDDGTAREIGVVEADTPALGRFARVRLLTAQFEPEAAGRSGTATFTVTRVGREPAPGE